MVYQLYIMASPVGRMLTFSKNSVGFNSQALRGNYLDAISIVNGNSTG